MSFKAVVVGLIHLVSYGNLQRLNFFTANMTGNLMNRKSSTFLKSAVVLTTFMSGLGLAQVPPAGGGGASGGTAASGAGAGVGGGAAVGAGVGLGLSTTAIVVGVVAAGLVVAAANGSGGTTGTR